MDIEEVSTELKVGSYIRVGPNSSKWWGYYGVVKSLEPFLHSGHRKATIELQIRHVLGTGQYPSSYFTLNKYIVVSLASNAFDVTYAHADKQKVPRRVGNVYWRGVICSNIAYYCKLDGRTDAELADQIGISRKTLNNYRLGKSEPLATTLIGIAKTVNVDVTKLLTVQVGSCDVINKEKIK
jgi:DNA-binding XRE family transcriptional regulator